MPEIPGVEGEETAMSDMWTYRDSTWTTSNDLVGYDVEATDGYIGKIDEATYDAFGVLRRRRHRVLDLRQEASGPRGRGHQVDQESEAVHVNLTKEQVKGAPDYDRDDWDDESRTRYNDYYGSPYGVR